MIREISHVCHPRTKIEEPIGMAINEITVGLQLVCDRPTLALSSALVPQRLVVLLFYVHGKHLRSCRDGQLT